MLRFPLRRNGFFIFFPDYLEILESFHTFAAVKSSATTYQSNRKLQENISFPATFNALYLAVSDNLLTHTHTHTHTHIRT